MELRHLRYFLAIAEEEHFGRAAARLHVAQPGLSRQMQDLERELGVLLFERLPRGVRLSDAGRAFMADCRRLIAGLGEATARARRVAAGLTGSLSIGFVESVSWAGAVPAILGAFRNRYPDIALSIRPTPSVAQIEAVRAGQLDAGFFYNRPNDPVFDSVRVSENDVAVALPAGDPLAERECVPAAAVVDRSFLGFPRHASPAYFDRLEAACLAAGLRRRPVQEAESEATLLSLVAAGIGLAVVNDANRWRKPDMVVLRPLEGISVPIALDLCWRADNGSAVLKSFVGVARMVCARDPERNRPSA